MRAGASITGGVGHGLEDRMEDVDAHGRADGVLEDGLVVIAGELVARLKRKILFERGSFLANYIIIC